MTLSPKPWSLVASIASGGLRDCRTSIEMAENPMAKTKQSYRFGESLVNVEIGDIIRASAQVIVSSDDTHLSMAGGVSKAIRKAGGEGIYDDAQKKRPASMGEIVVTSAGALAQCQHIFHAITRAKGSAPNEDRVSQRAIIESATRQCLDLLRAMNLRSIAFPALGTGFSGFEPGEVAIAMAKVIIEDLVQAKSPVEVSIYLLPEAIGNHVDFREFFNRFDETTGLVHKVVRDHAVVMIHGILTDARWFEKIEDVLKRGDHQLYPVASGYGYFDLIRFLLPLRATRNAVVAKVKRRVDNLLKEQPQIRKVSVIAHSFGSFVVGEMLRTDSTLRLHRLLLCGAILPADYPWEKHAHQIESLNDPNHVTRRLINDCGWRDVWPVFAQSITWGYGSSGRFGFQTHFVRDRFHDLGHSEFFTEKFCNEFWLSALSDGLVRDGAVERPSSPWWLQPLTVFKLLYLVLLGLVWLVVWLVF